MTTRLIFAVSLFVLPGLLFGQSEDGATAPDEGTGFYDGRFFMELKGVAGASYEGEAYSEIRNLYEPDLPLYTYLRGTNDQQLLASLVYQDARRPDVDSYGGEILFEWAMNDWLGLGFTAHHEAYSATNIRSIDTSFLLSLASFSSSFASSSSTSSGSNNLDETFILLELLSPLNTTTVNFLGISTLDFNIAFHFLDRAFVDPYLRFIVGAGYESELAVGVIRGGATIGARWFVGDTFYIATEGNYSNYWVTGSSDETANEEVNGRFAEGSGALGFGFAI